MRKGGSSFVLLDLGDPLPLLMLRPLVVVGSSGPTIAVLLLLCGRFCLVALSMERRTWRCLHRGAAYPYPVTYTVISHDRGAFHYLLC